MNFWNKGIADDPKKKNTKGKHHTNPDLGWIKYELFFLQFIFIDRNQDAVTIVGAVCKDLNNHHRSDNGKDITQCGSRCQLREDGCLASMEIGSIDLRKRQDSSSHAPYHLREGYIKDRVSKSLPQKSSNDSNRESTNGHGDQGNRNKTSRSFHQEIAIHP